MVVPYNVVPVLDERVAAVIVEPVAANMGVVAPVPGFLEGLRAECDRVGALLVLDEVITGFRLATGGAQELFGVSADLTTFGKVIGGGLPIGCVGGRRDIMETLSPLGPVFHAGTLSGNPLATAAGRAALAELTPDAYRLLRVSAARLSAALTAACEGAGLPATFPVVGTLVGMYFGASLGAGIAPQNFAEAKTTDEAVYRTFFHAMLAEGVALAPGAYEALFVGLGHTDEVIDAVGVAAARAAVVAATARPTT
jgi:glutamate-1-semialdehyde 2,1-aminomutase